MSHPRLRRFFRVKPDSARTSPAFPRTGERHFRRAITEFVEHDHLERNHQGLDNRLITPMADAASRVRRRSRLGGLLNYYERAA
jgi:hypothetical protein